MATISVELDDKKKYNGIILHFIDSNNVTDTISVFTGDFVKDWFVATRSYLTDILTISNIESNLVLSVMDSVEQYLFDNKKKYVSAIFTLDDDVPELHYIKSGSYKERAKYRTGWEVFLPAKKNWTWDEYKAYCTE